MKLFTLISAFSFLFIACSSSNSSGEGEIVINSPGGITTEQYSIAEDADGHYYLDGAYQTWYDSGFPKVRGEFSMGEMDGEWQKWKPTGLLSERLTFEEGKKSGPASYYDENGEVRSEGNFSENKRDGTWKYYDNGELQIIHQIEEDNFTTLNDTQWKDDSGTEYIFAENKIRTSGDQTAWPYELSNRQIEIDFGRSARFDITYLLGDSLEFVFDGGWYKPSKELRTIRLKRIKGSE